MNSMSLTRNRRPVAWALAASALAISPLGLIGGASIAHATPDTGGFELAVLVNVDNDHLFPVDRVWEVSYKCGTEEAQTVLLEDNATHVVSDIPVGTTCTIDPLVDKAAIEGYSLDQEVAVNGTLTRDVTILAGSTPAVEIANAYTYQPGVFRVTTTTKGDGMAKATGPFTYDWSCTHLGQNVGGGTFSIAEGEAKNILGLPAGAECTVTRVNHEVEGTTLETMWDTDYSTPAPGNAMKFTVNDWSAVNIQVTNTYTLTNPVPVEKGTFEVTASATTTDGSPAPVGTYDFSVGCWHNGENMSADMLGVSSDGTPVVSPLGPLPIGASCTLSAKIEGSHRAGYTLVDPMPVPENFIIDNPDTPVRVNMKYTYAQEVGALELVVKTEGHPTANADTFPVTYNCGNGDTTADMKGDGTVGTHDGLAAGANCTVTPDAAAAERDGYTVATTVEGAPAVIPANGVARVTVTNVYTPKPVDQPQSAGDAGQSAQSGDVTQSADAAQSAGDVAQSAAPVDPAQSAGDANQSAGNGAQSGDTAQSADATQSVKPVDPAQSAGDTAQSAGDAGQSAQSGDVAQSGDAGQSTGDDDQSADVAQSLQAGGADKPELNLPQSGDAAQSTADDDQSAQSGDAGQSAGNAPQSGDAAQSAAPVDPAQSAGDATQSAGNGAQSGDTAQSVKPGDANKPDLNLGQSGDAGQSAKPVDPAQSAGNGAQSGDASQSAQSGDTGQSTDNAAQSSGKSGQSDESQKNDQQKGDDKDNQGGSTNGNAPQAGDKGSLNLDPSGNQGNAGANGATGSTGSAGNGSNAGTATPLTPLTPKSQNNGAIIVPGGNQGSSSSSSSQAPSTESSTATSNNAVPMTEVAKENPVGTGRLAITGTNAQLLLMTSLLTLLVGAGVITAIRRAS